MACDFSTNASVATMLPEPNYICMNFKFLMGYASDSVWDLRVPSLLSPWL